MNMLPIGPLDGGLMWKAFTEKMRQGEQLQKAMTYIFLGLILGNMAMSLTRFGFVPI
jgi:membrane-associated protease RseP (regulator of RpoE activity)